MPGRTVLFAVSEKRGIWGSAQPIPGIEALLGRSRSGAYVTDLSCPSAGNCAAGGYAGPAGSAARAFVVTQKNGTWRKAGEVPGTAQLNTGGDAGMSQITCPSAGNCLGVGSYTGSKGGGPFAVTEKNGRWGSARAFPRIIARSPERTAYFTADWCQTTSNCLTTGGYLVSTNAGVVFAIHEKNRIWGPITLIRLPVTAASAMNGPEPGDAAACDAHDIESILGPTLSAVSVGDWGIVTAWPHLPACSLTAYMSLGLVTVRTVPLAVQLPGDEHEMASTSEKYPARIPAPDSGSSGPHRPLLSLTTKA